MPTITFIHPEVFTDEDRDIAAEAIDILDARGWCQDTLINEKNEVCLEGAIADAILIRSGWSPMSLDRAVPNEVYTRYGEWTAHFNRATGCRYVPNAWNDLPDTTAEDVKLCLKEIAYG